MCVCIPIHMIYPKTFIPAALRERKRMSAFDTLPSPLCHCHIVMHIIKNVISCPEIRGDVTVETNNSGEACRDSGCEPRAEVFAEIQREAAPRRCSSAILFVCGTMKSILSKSTGGEAYWRGIGLAARWHGSRVVLGGSQTELFSESVYALWFSLKGKGLKREGDKKNCVHVANPHGCSGEYCTY